MKTGTGLPAVFTFMTVMVVFILVTGIGRPANVKSNLEQRPADSLGITWQRFGDISWIFVQGGEFKMGSNSGNANERPAHMVSVKSFYLSATEVTFEQYDLFCDSTGRNKHSDNRWGRGTHPVINVSWYDAVA